VDTHMCARLEHPVTLMRCFSEETLHGSARLARDSRTSPFRLRALSFWVAHAHFVQRCLPVINTETKYYPPGLSPQRS